MGAKCLVIGIRLHFRPLGTKIEDAANIRAGGCDIPVAVPEKNYGLSLFLVFFDRCHSLLLAVSAAGSARSRPHWHIATELRIPSSARKKTDP